VARVELGKLLRRKGETEASIALLREALELYETAEARRELAQALEEAGKNSEALAEWTKLLPDPEAAAGRGQAFPKQDFCRENFGFRPGLFQSP
jgi:tetratricopeptide (TPR) repeat protein